MAFQTPNVRQELANRKILEELQLKKQMLLKQGVTQSSMISTPSSLPMGMGHSPAVLGATGEMQMMSPTQRLALQNANAQSFGFFVCQDSSFGNLILPVLPRFENKQ